MKYSKLSHDINYSLSAHQDVFYSNEQMGFDAENKPKVRFKPEYRMFSSPEPKAHGELIVYRSIRRPSICPPSVNISNRNISTTSGPIAIKF